MSFILCLTYIQAKYVVKDVEGSWTRWEQLEDLTKLLWILFSIDM